MSRVIAHIFLTAFIFIAGYFPCVFAQEPEIKVNRSEDKVILEGKVYYIHIVKEKETLYGISKAYNVSEKVIAAENPDVFAGLRPGMVLKIPAEPVIREVEEIRETDEFFYHVIKEGETLYFLSRKYGIDVSEIENFNPEVKYSELQINQVLKIPKRKKPVQEEGFTVNDFIYHYVKAGETLYSLSEMYDVSIEQIKELNPRLRWGELKYNEYIKIPAPQDSLDRMPEGTGIDSTGLDSVSMNSMFRDTLLWDSVLLDSDLRDSTGIIIDSARIPFWSQWPFADLHPEPAAGPIKVAMLLPLHLHWEEYRDTLEVDTLDQDLIEPVEEEEEESLNPRLIPYLEFYQGALLAMDSLRKKGISVSLFVFDTERNRTRTREILMKSEMKEMDLIIGPVNFWNLEVVAEFARKNRIPMVSPFSSESRIVKYNPWVFQLTPDIRIEYRKWAEYLSDNYDKTMILIHSGDSLELPRISYLKNELFRRITAKADLKDLVYKEVVYNDSMKVEMNHVLNKEGDNLVIIPSDDEAYVSTVMSPLYYLLDEYRIEISGMPQWSSFDNIDLEYFHELNTSYYTSFHIDYEKEDLMAFIHKFRDVYRTEPYKIRPRGYNLSVYGFDILNYFVTAIGDYGQNFIFFAENMEGNPLLGPYRFRRINDFGGHINAYITIIRYHPDLNIDQVELENRPNQYRYQRYSGINLDD